MRMKRKGRLLLVLGIVFLVLAGGIAWSQVTERVSVDTTGSDADSASSNPSTSSNGSYEAFQSDATDLVAGGSNGSMHIFVRDRQTPTTTQVSVDSAGNEANAASSSPSISSDGRYVAFESDADNLLGVGNDTNGWPNVFVHDRDADGDGMYDEAGEVSTIRVSVYSDETESIDPSNNPSISADGGCVTFQSDANNLLGVGNDNNGAPDVFADDLQAGAGGGGGGGGGCFIATAADGSGMAGEVK